MPLVPLCTEESWYQWDDSLSVPTCSIHFNTYAFPSCSSLFPLMMPYVSLLPVYHLFIGLNAFQTEGHGKWSGHANCMGLTEVWWHNEEQTHCDWPWGFEKRKKILSCSLSLRDPRWQKDRVPLWQNQEFCHSSKLSETAAAGWVVRVSCHHPL